MFKLENIVKNIVGSFYNGSRIRIQYRDDEGTFVTVSDENAVRAATPVPNTGEFKLIRLCLSFDDVVTPVGKAGQNSAINIKNSVSETPLTVRGAKKELEYNTRPTAGLPGERSDSVIKKSTHSINDSKPLSVETLFQRYTKKAKNDIEEKKAELLDLEMKDQEIQGVNFSE